MLWTFPWLYRHLAQGLSSHLACPALFGSVQVWLLWAADFSLAHLQPFGAFVTIWAWRSLISLFLCLSLSDFLFAYFYKSFTYLFIYLEVKEWEWGTGDFLSAGLLPRWSQLLGLKQEIISFIWVFYESDRRPNNLGHCSLVSKAMSWKLGWCPFGMPALKVVALPATYNTGPSLYLSQNKTKIRQTKVLMPQFYKLYVAKLFCLIFKFLDNLYTILIQLNFLSLPLFFLTNLWFYLVVSQIVYLTFFFSGPTCSSKTFYSAHKVAVELKYLALVVWYLNEAVKMRKVASLPLGKALWLAHE